MLVRHRMSSPAITVTPDTTFSQAFRILKENNIRRLPVVDGKGKLVGIVTLTDLLRASPSPATSLSIFELNYLLDKLKVEEVMSRPAITTSPDTPLEEAARIMVDRKISGLPVVEDGKVVGVITETDIFKTFVEMLGGRLPGVRITLKLREHKGALAEIAGTIAQMGGNIIAVGTFFGEDPETRYVTLRVSDLWAEELKAALAPYGEVTDVHDMRHVVGES